MSFQIFQLLNADEVARICECLQAEVFIDGRSTAQTLPLEMKNNLQFGRDPKQGDKHLATQWVEQALGRHSDFLQYTLARSWVPPSFSRYEVGMYYREHIDAAMMSSANGVVRSDFAMTLFLSDPKSYQGGELVLRSAYGEEEIKLDAGQAVVYHANLLHRVEPVTSGSRLVCLSWIQSQIADERYRQINQDLQRALGRLEHSKPNLEAITLIIKAQQNLLRIVTSGL